MGNQRFFPFIAFVIGCIGISFFFSWIIKASGGRLLSDVIAHATVNTFACLFPAFIMKPNVFQVRYWIHMVLFFIVGAIFMITVKKKIN